MQSSSLVKEWSSPAQRTVVGVQKGPSERAETYRVAREEQDVRILTPSFKTTTTGLSGSTTAISPGSNTTTIKTAASKTGDYKVEERQDHYKLHIIDPKVSSHSYIPAAATLPTTTTYRKRYQTPDFPSAHSKRSFMKLEPLEQRRLRSVEMRPVTTGSYLTESLERHRAMVASPLKDELKVAEKDVLKPWEKPDRPGYKAGEDFTVKSERVYTSQKLPVVNSTPKRNEELNELARLRQELIHRAQGRDKDFYGHPPEIQHQHKETVVQQHNHSSTLPVVKESVAATWQFSNQSFSPRTLVSVNGHKDDPGLLRVRTDLSPMRQQRSASTQQQQEITTTRTSSRNSNRQQSYNQQLPMQTVLVPLNNNNKMNTHQSPSNVTHERREEKVLERYHSLPHLEEDRKPKSIMKRQAFEDGQMQILQNGIVPPMTQQIQQVEETRRTEEIERRIQRKDRKEKRHHHKSGRHHHQHSGGYRHHHQDAIEYGGGMDDDYGARNPWASPIGGQGYGMSDRQSSTINRQQVNGQHRRRHGSMSGSLRRHDATYMPNGDIRMSSRRSDGGSRMHKSRSSRDVYHHDGDSQLYAAGGPIVEYPPTLPRGGTGPPPAGYYGGGSFHHHSHNNDFNNSSFHRNQQQQNALTKSRSFADWERDHQHPPTADMTMARWEDSYVSELERDFRDSLMMPLPSAGSQVNERDFREEPVPGGGHESLLKQVNSHSGRKHDPNNPNSITNYSEAKQEYHYKKETEGGSRRR